MSAVASLAVALVLAGVGVTITMSEWSHANTNTEAVLVLSSSQVEIGDSYFAVASRFTPNEPIRFSWTGPTNGTMDTVLADTTGSRRHGPIVERDPPGRYIIIATGLRSGRTASAVLEVVLARADAEVGGDLVASTTMVTTMPPTDLA